MPWSFTNAEGEQWQDIDFLQQFLDAWAERSDVSGFDAVTDTDGLAAGDDCQELNTTNLQVGTNEGTVAVIRALQQAVEQAATNAQTNRTWLNPADPVDTGVASIPSAATVEAGYDQATYLYDTSGHVNWMTLAIMRSGAGLNASGFTRKYPTDGEDSRNGVTTAYGIIQAGDMIGDWLFDELKAAINEFMFLAVTTDSGHASGIYIDEVKGLTEAGTGEGEGLAESSAGNAYSAASADFATVAHSNPGDPDYNVTAAAIQQVTYLSLVDETDPLWDAQLLSERAKLQVSGLPSTSKTLTLYLFPAENFAPLDVGWGNTPPGPGATGAHDYLDYLGASYPEGELSQVEQFTSSTAATVTTTSYIGDHADTPPAVASGDPTTEFDASADTCDGEPFGVIEWTGFDFQ